MKKAFTLVELIAIIIIMALMALIAVPSINNIIKKSEENKKNEALNSIYMAAENYLLANYDDYSSLDNVGSSEYIYVLDLINSQYIDIDTLNPNDDEAFNNKDVVKVTRNTDNTFSYELIVFKSLIEELLSQYNESNTVGLLKDDTNPNIYYYKGTNEEVANNHLWYGGHHWRIIEFDTEANTLTLISQQPLTAIQPASAVWDTETEYNASYINTWLNDYFYNSLDSSIQNNILDSTFNVGIYTDVDEITTIKKVGLLDGTQYTRAGENSEGYNSYLYIEDDFWLGNRYTSSDVSVAFSTQPLDYNGSVSMSYGVRAVIKIFDVNIIEGDGTLTSNYKVGTKAANTNDVQVGEYINVPYNGTDNACGSDNKCTFRVVSKDIANNRIKVVLNGLLPTTSAWANNTSDDITTSDLIYTNVLNSFIINIGSQDITESIYGVGNVDRKYITEGTYGVGLYEAGDSYTVPQATTIIANVGLPTVGEMFSGNDIDLSTSSTKTFVDVNTIENPTVSNWYWTMNRYISSDVRNVDSDGKLSTSYPSFARGVRPTIYLKSGTSTLTFSGGKGTAQEPYELQ